MSVDLVDTHCHIHDSEFNDRFVESPDKMLKNAARKGVNRVICVGTEVSSSRQAVEFCKKRKNCKATLAIHPHEAAKKSLSELKKEMKELEKLTDDPGVVGIGETGLDYFYHDDPKTHEKQVKLFRMHIKLALKHDLPMSFHIRDPKNKQDGELGSAFASFFRIIDEYENVRGVVHSFSAGVKELEGSLDRGFYIGLNGITTFTKDKNQLDAAREVPLEKLLLETDAPFLTPAPFRAIVCEPMHVRVTAEFLSKLRGENLEKFAKITTANAQTLFKRI